MIEVNGDDIIAATLDGKPLYPASVLEGETVTIAEPKDGYTAENRARGRLRESQAKEEMEQMNGAESEGEHGKV